MGSVKTPPRVPIIDLTEESLISGADRTCDDVRRALEEFWCFEALYDKVTPELHEATFSVMEELFNLPTQVKSQNTCEPHFSYKPKRQSAMYEALGIVDATNFEDAQNFTTLMWPQQESNYCEILHSYAMRLSELEQRVKKMVFQSLNVEKLYNSHAETITYVLRLMKYDGPMADEAIIGVASHTDMSFCTILHQNEVEGLQVQTKEGEWIRVQLSSPSSFIVIAGDPFYAWSNGRVYAPHHRVMMSGYKARYSTALFSFSRGIIECPKELIDEKHPLLFKPFDHHSFVGFYHTEGKEFQSPLKAYCGVTGIP